ncbi:GGDEF domain-containing protein [Rhodovulum strictum]|uniref:Diguanylate cyclase n=1 Tax=Rhodovulum strictum TaxID=58314 RepID=A0A844B8G0_9RHOB|nr:diguanylate cyclase [Rhodovulum strictum]MRH22581.1 diguanylate cyclase [Rhodovulum strictum]
MEILFIMSAIVLPPRWSNPDLLLASLLALTVLGCLAILPLLDPGPRPAWPHPLLLGGFLTLALGMVIRRLCGRLPLAVSALGAVSLIVILHAATGSTLRPLTGPAPNDWPLALGLDRTIRSEAAIVLCALHMSMLGDLWGRRLSLVMLGIAWAGTVFTVVAISLGGFERMDASGLLLICILLALLAQTWWLKDEAALRAVFSRSRFGLLTRLLLVAAVIVPLASDLRDRAFGAAATDNILLLSAAASVVSLATITLVLAFGHTLYRMDQLRAELARYDLVTGIVTCKGLQDGAGPDLRHHGVILFSIDDFATLEDTFGPGFGEDLLRHVAQTLWANLRKNDILARGADAEFAAFVDVPDIESLSCAATRLRESLENAEHREDGKNYPRISVSFGTSMVEPWETNIDSALQRAKANLPITGTSRIAPD